jgi:hypothetical protein
MLVRKQTHLENVRKIIKRILHKDLVKMREGFDSVHDKIVLVALVLAVKNLMVGREY